MCLAVPLQIVSLTAGRRAIVRRGEGSLEIDVSLLESPQVGDYVLVHAGYAIGTVDQDEAAETLRLLEEIDPGADG
jgi:hydrogenase expression/formation protein HypC